MTTLAERIAARKLSTGSVQEQAPQVETKVESKSISPSAVVAVVEDALSLSLVKKEPVINTDKPLTFAEKMALRKTSMPLKETVVPVAETISSNKLPSTVIEKIQASIVAAIKTEATDEQIEDFLAAPPEVQQSYLDIKQRILALSATFDDDLAVAMTELKKALLQNPNACLLMLDEDIGMMTIGLRRRTMEALIEGTADKADKKTGTKAKKTAQIPLSADAMQKVFDEL